MKCKCDLYLLRSAVMSSLLPLQPLLLSWLSLGTIIDLLPSGRVLNHSFMCALSLHSKSPWAKLDPFRHQLVAKRHKCSNYPLILELSFRGTSESTEIKPSPFYSLLVINTVSSVFAQSHSQPLSQSIFVLS